MRAKCFHALEIWYLCALIAGQISTPHVMKRYSLKGKCWQVSVDSNIGKGTIYRTVIKCPIWRWKTLVSYIFDILMCTHKCLLNYWFTCSFRHVYMQDHVVILQSSRPYAKPGSYTTLVVYQLVLHFYVQIIAQTG